MLRKRDIMSKVKIGIIGYGNMGTSHVDNLMAGKVPNMELTAVCDISQPRREALKEKYPQIPVFADAEELYKSGLLRRGGDRGSPL